MGSKKLVVIGCLSLLAIFILTTAYMGATHSLLREYQVVESDGHRQREYKVFGFIPYEKQEEAQELHVVSDFWQAASKSGLVFGPEIDKKREGMMVIRTLRAKKKPSYYLSTTVKGDYGKLVAFYCKQLKLGVPTFGKSIMVNSWTKSAGAQISLSFELKAPGVKPGEDEIGFRVDMETL